MDQAKRLVQEAKAAGVAVDAPITSATRRGIYARHDEFSEYTASQLQAIGLNARSQIVEPAEHQAQLSFGGYDKVPKERGWITNNPHSNEILDVSRTMQGYYRCTGGASTHCDPEIDKAIDAALPLSGDARAKAFQAIAQRFYESYAIIPVIHMDLLHATSKRLQWTPRIDGFLILKEMSLAG
jgi:peptide/nickel transport system substrate-binding protein